MRNEGWKKRVRNVLGILGAAFFFLHSSLFIFTACEGIDCTLDNVVTLNIGFYSSESGAQVSVTDTLNVTAEGTDSVLLNRGRNIQKLTLPMSYWQEADTLRLQFHGGDEDYSYEYYIVLRITKSNQPHFESPDCPTTMFHEITDLDYDDPYHLTDSIIVENTDVNYAALENIKIYFRGSAD